MKRSSVDGERNVPNFLTGHRTPARQRIPMHRRPLSFDPVEEKTSATERQRIARSIYSRLAGPSIAVNNRRGSTRTSASPTRGTYLPNRRRRFPQRARPRRLPRQLVGWQSLRTAAVLERKIWQHILPRAFLCSHHRPGTVFATAVFHTIAPPKKK